jgi:ribose-phosphate pyrophosphokinase
VQVISRLKSAQDIMNLLHVLDIVRSHTDKTIEVVLPYLPYSRADRRFTKGDTFGLKVFLHQIEVYEPVVIRTLDIHSTKVPLSFVRNSDPKVFIRKAIDATMVDNNADSINVLLPDEGSTTRYPWLNVLERAGLGIRVLNCSKKRDPKTGALSGFEVPAKEEFLPAPILIVDDLCDGGGTFMGIGAQLRKEGINNPLNLYVTHGIFSKGLDGLFGHFNQIFTTNSVEQVKPGNARLTVYDMMPLLTK